MTRKLTLTAAAALAITFGAALPAAPAYAGGSISISVAPNSPDEARAMRLGLGMYAIAKGFKNGGISQNGFGNVAGLAQNGGGNFGVVHQKGDGHNGTLTQNGHNNSYGLFQFGKNTNGHVRQNGHGGTGATFQFGW